MLSGVPLMIQAAVFDGEFLDPFSPFDNGGGAAEVGVSRRDVALSFPPKTGPLFLETEGGCDGSETTFGRGYTEAST